jgi:hypothetical protein
MIIIQLIVICGCGLDRHLNGDLKKKGISNTHILAQDRTVWNCLGHVLGLRVCVRATAAASVS